MDKIEVKAWRSKDGKKLWYKLKNRRLAAQLIKHDDGENVIHLQYTRPAEEGDSVHENNIFRSTNGRTTTSNVILGMEAAEVTIHALSALLDADYNERSTS
jgi:hypothetical protein